jgi:hypothetical protein
MTTTIHDIICGDLGSTDHAAFSRCGQYLAVVGAPGSTLKVFSTDSLSKVRIPSAKNVDKALLRANGDDVELLYCVSRSGVINRYLLKSRRTLPALTMPQGYDLHALTDNADGSVVAAGDSYGDIRVWRFNGDNATLVHSRREVDTGIYAMALTRGNAYYYATACGRQWKHDLTADKAEPLHGRGLKWDCFTMASHDAHGGVAMAGDSNRIWLVDMPSKLEPRDEHSAGDGFPVENWELDMVDSPRFSLRQRIYLPAAGPDRCSYIDSDSGALIAKLYMTTPKELVVVGDNGIEVWGLSPLNLLYSRGHRNSPSRRIFGAVRRGDRILIAREK